jgi:hypothetical protein
VHAFISSKLDFCNSLLYGIPEYLLYKLKKIQHHATRIITGAKMSTHITPIMHKLHWLPVDARIKFKILAFVHKFIYSGQPAYLDIEIRRISRVTRQTMTPTLVQPPTRLHSTGDRAFSSAAPVLWNRLPASLRCIEDYKSFKQHLKTYLFSQH